MSGVDSGSFYEAHVTYDARHSEIIKKVLDSNILSDSKITWSFSQIDGDPHLGKGIKCYLTAHWDNYDYLLLSMIELSKSILVKEGVAYLRMKVEKIVFDTYSK